MRIANDHDMDTDELVATIPVADVSKECVNEWKAKMNRESERGPQPTHAPDYPGMSKKLGIITPPPRYSGRKPPQ